MYDELKQIVCRANIELQTQKLVIYTWGNVSGIDRKAGIVAIKPSGVSYDQLTPEKICHTHSPNATMWAQACREIPCFGTTHADHFYGAVPVTKPMKPNEIKNDYELNTGKVIVKRFAAGKIDPMQMPACLVACHGPFTWGKNPDKAVENAVVLEQVAAMASCTIVINKNQKPISSVLLDKHYLRKHGKDAYYGQKS
jgi:L-ribulose-5-phosphate 4-epimerase